MVVNRVNGRESQQLGSQSAHGHETSKVARKAYSLEQIQGAGRKGQLAPRRAP